MAIREEFVPHDRTAHSREYPERRSRGDVEFAESAARRVYADHAMFRGDHDTGAVRYWDAA